MRRASLIITTGLLVTISLAATVSGQTSSSTRYEPDLASSRVTVEGTSTVHDWTVESQVLRGELILHDIDPAALWTTRSPQPLRATVRVEIPVDSLKSDNSGLNKRMYEALKAKSYPIITYRLERVEVQASKAPGDNDTEGVLTFQTTGVLTVAGVDQAVDIPMQVKQLPDDRLEVSGDTRLRMTAFGIEPPRAMLGMLRTGDEVRVRWTWVLVRQPS